MSSAADNTSSQNHRNAVHTVHVALGDRSYDVLVGRGVLGELTSVFKHMAPNARAAVIADQTVLDHHGNTLEAMLADEQIPYAVISVAPGETSKSFAEVERVCAALLDGRFERNDIVIAFGGGVIGDLAGFCAAVTLRGMRFIQVPTSLLAQVDSSVGGKTGIDTPHGKNLVGAFHQPLAVIADTSLLDTLDDRQMRAGYAEVVKYGLLGDKEFFDWLEVHWQDVFNGTGAREEAVSRSVAAKAKIVAEDELEAGIRALLNLGHTFGHALEAAAGYSDRLLHGEAIAIGMTMAFRYSNEQGLCSGQDAERAIAHFNRVGLPTSVNTPAPGLVEDMGGASGMLALMQQDKKVERGALTLILVRGVGEAFIAKDVPQEPLADFLSRELARP